jgi:fucose permease
VTASPRTLAILAGIAFVGLGLPDGLLGVAWPSMRATFGVPLDALGALLTAFTIGFVGSSFSSGRILRRLGLGVVLALSCGVTGACLLAYAATRSWWTVVALGVVAGMGAGGIDTGVNTYAAMRHGPRLLNVLHACWGVGATAGPALMTGVLAAGLPWQAGYLAVGGAQVTLALLFVGSQRAWPAARASDDARGASILETLRLPSARLLVLLFVCYTGLELGVGAWAFTVLTEGRGVAATTAGAWTSLYWLALTGGRLVGAALVGRLGATNLLRGTMVLLVAGLTVFAAGLSPALDLVGLALAGLSAGPIFPTLIAETPARLGRWHAANGVGFQIAAAGLGQALWPSALGLAGARLGLGALAYGLVALGLLVLAIHARLATRALPSEVP